nr:general odorant-binding protein 19d-like [Leptinotarsa decemlineata]
MFQFIENSKMRSFIAFALLIVATQAKLDPELVQELMEKLTEAAAKCGEKIKPSSEDISKLLSHKVPDTTEGRCMLLCVNQELGFEKEDGSIDFENGKIIMDKVKDSDPEIFNKLFEVYKKCSQTDYIVKDDPCETSANLATCGIKGAEEEGISFDLGSM